MSAQLTGNLLLILGLIENEYEIHQAKVMSHSQFTYTVQETIIISVCHELSFSHVY